MVKRLIIDDVEIEEIPVSDIRSAYCLIEKDLRSVSNKSYAEWIPADVYACLMEGSAVLYIFYKKEEYIGFSVLAVTTNMLREKSLLVWIGYQKPPHTPVGAGFKLYDKVADELGVSSIEFHSSRPGWGKVAPKYGYEFVTNMYRKEL